MSSSPFLARLNSNYAAEEDNMPQLDSIIIQSTIELESIRIEMERTRQLYMELSGQHERLLNYMEAHRALLSPARRLPVEVLQEIFHHCSLDKLEGSLVDHRQAPVLLTHICSSWRRVAIATPSLWSSIHIVSPRHKLEAQGQTQNMQTIYKRTLRAITSSCPALASPPPLCLSTSQYWTQTPGSQSQTLPARKSSPWYCGTAKDSSHCR